MEKAFSKGDERTEWKKRKSRPGRERKRMRAEIFVRPRGPNHPFSHRGLLSSYTRCIIQYNSRLVKKLAVTELRHPWEKGLFDPPSEPRVEVPCCVVVINNNPWENSMKDERSPAFAARWG